VDVGFHDYITTAHYSLGLFATLSATRAKITKIKQIMSRKKAPFLQAFRA
jgi:hypothetical protein